MKLIIALTLLIASGEPEVPSNGYNFYTCSNGALVRDPQVEEAKGSVCTGVTFE